MHALQGPRRAISCWRGALLQGPRTRHLLLAGCLFGLLCLTRASFVVLAPVVPALIAFHGLSRLSKPGRSVVVQCAAFALGWLVMVTPWFVRNGVSVGRRSLSEEYGCAALNASRSMK